MLHEDFQRRRLPKARELAGLPETATLVETVEALDDSNFIAEAFRLLFGAEQGPSYADNYISYICCTQLQEGRHPGMITRIARHHHWSTLEELGLIQGVEFQIYPGEWLVVDEPVATEVFQKLLC